MRIVDHNYSTQLSQFFVLLLPILYLTSAPPMLWYPYLNLSKQSSKRGDEPPQDTEQP